MLHHDVSGIKIVLLLAWPFPEKEYIDLGKLVMFYFSAISLLFL